MHRAPSTACALAFTATPAQHFSGRGVTGRNRTLWSSWVIETANRRLQRIVENDAQAAEGDADEPAGEA